MDFNIFTGVAAVVTTLAAVLFAARKLKRFFLPLRIEPTIRRVLDGSALDSIEVTVTNRSNETVHISQCVARGTYSFKEIAFKHLKHPLTKPRLYPNMWYHGAVYSLSEEPIKLEPSQPVTLVCELYGHRLNAVYAPFLLFIVTLSSGSKFRGGKIHAPKIWREIGTRLDVPSTSSFYDNAAAKSLGDSKEEQLVEQGAAFNP